MDIIRSKQLDWTEFGTGSVPCRECRMLLGTLRGAGHEMTLHEDAGGVVHLEIKPRVRPTLERNITQHKEHMVATLIMVSLPQTLTVEKGQRNLDGQWHWETVAERETSYAKAPGAWDDLLRQIGSWSDGTSAYRAKWQAAGKIRRAANFAPRQPRRQRQGQGENKA